MLSKWRTEPKCSRPSQASSEAEILGAVAALRWSLDRSNMGTIVYSFIKPRNLRVSVMFSVILYYGCFSSLVLLSRFISTIFHDFLAGCCSSHDQAFSLLGALPSLFPAWDTHAKLKVITWGIVEPMTREHQLLGPPPWHVSRTTFFKI